MSGRLYRDYAYKVTDSSDYPKIHIGEELRVRGKKFYEILLNNGNILLVAEENAEQIDFEKMRLK